MTYGTSSNDEEERRLNSDRDAESEPTQLCNSCGKSDCEHSGLNANNGISIEHGEVLYEEPALAALRQAVYSVLHSALFSAEYLSMLSDNSIPWPTATSSTRLNTAYDSVQKPGNRNNSLKHQKSFLLRDNITSSLLAAAMPPKLLFQRDTEDSRLKQVDPNGLEQSPNRKPRREKAVSHFSLSQNLNRNHYTAENSYEWVVPNGGLVRLTDHCPLPFLALREAFDFSLATLEQELIAPLMVNATEGKSDAVFLESKTKKFLFKSLRGVESDNLKSFLPHYLEFVEANPDTLLPRYLGMYTFEFVSKRLSSPASNGYSNVHDRSSSSSLASFLNGKTTFILMANVFGTSAGIDKRFDFKGSNIGREALKSDEFYNFLTSHTQCMSSSKNLLEPCANPMQSLPLHLGDMTFKELDFRRMLDVGIVNLIQLGPDNRQWLLERLKSDTELLKQHGFMDYSLLVGIQTKRRPVQKSPMMRNKRSGPLPSGSSTSINMNGLPPSVFDVSTSSISSSNLLFSDKSASQHRLQYSRSYGEFASSSSQKQSTVPAAGFSQYLPSILGQFVSFQSPILRGSNSQLSSSDSRDDLMSSKHGSPFQPARDDFERQRLLDDYDGLDDHSEANASNNQHRFGEGIRSEGDIAPDIEYEIYYFGVIDILQKYNFSKWLEKGLKRQTSQMIIAGPSSFFSSSAASTNLHNNMGSSVASVLSSQSHTSGATPGSSAADSYQALRYNRRNMLRGRPPQINTAAIVEEPENILEDDVIPPQQLKSPKENETYLFDGPLETSVEEPNRYASRLVHYIESITI